MNQANQQKARILPMRRVALLATTVAGLAVGGFLVSPTLSPYAPVAQAQNLSQQAQTVARPTGFADIVEKVKPAVFSVRVKVRAEAQPSASLDDENPFPKGSPMEKFFKRFGMPEGGLVVRAARACRADVSSVRRRVPASSFRRMVTP